jgi:4-hydroxy-tetrahydrodipicolinate synthase
MAGSFLLRTCLAEMSAYNALNGTRHSKPCWAGRTRVAAKLEWNLRGVILPLITPFKEDLSVDYQGLTELVEYFVDEKGVDGLVPCGTTGESATLTHAEHVEVIEAVVKQTHGRVPVIASTGSNSTQEAVELTRLAQDAGADATLQVGPYYNKPTQQGLFNHFAEVANATKLPLIIYNIPGRTSRNIEPETIIRLWDELPTVVGLKDCCNDLHQTMMIYRGTHPDTFKIYSGEDVMTLSLLCHGAAGAIAAVGHVVAPEVKAMCEAVWAGRIQDALSIHYRIMDVVDALFCEPNPTPVKQALEWLGLPAGPLRPPLERMTSTGQEVLRLAMRAGGWLG